MHICPITKQTTPTHQLPTKLPSQHPKNPFKQPKYSTLENIDGSECVQVPFACGHTSSILCVFSTCAPLRLLASLAAFSFYIMGEPEWRWGGRGEAPACRWGFRQWRADCIIIIILYFLFYLFGWWFVCVGFWKCCVSEREWSILKLILFLFYFWMWIAQLKF